MKSPQKPIPRVSPKKASKGFQWPKRSRIKKKPRKLSETLRIYGSKARRDFVRGLPCAACGVGGYSVQAHVLGNGGTGRKADADTIAPLCGQRPDGRKPGNFYYTGCHFLFDEMPWEFKPRFPDFDPGKAAADTQAAWIAHSQEKA